MDGIFTEDELKAQEAAPDAELPAVEPVEQGGQDRARGPDGKFLPKEETLAVAEPVEGEPEPKKGSDTVPQGALHAEREKRKGVEAELTKVRDQLAAIAKMREEVAARKPEELPAADDPAALEHLRTRIAEQDRKINRFEQNADNSALAEREAQELGSFMAESEAKYREQKPDYDKAIEHVVLMRANELSLYGLNRAQIQQAISEEATEIVRSAAQQGRDPAELGYQIALSRGYRPAEGQTEVKPNGGAQATLDAIAAAKAKSKSLGAGGGSAPKNLTAEAVAAMSQDEFEALYSTDEGKALIDAL